MPKMECSVINTWTKEPREQVQPHKPHQPAIVRYPPYDLYKRSYTRLPTSPIVRVRWRTTALKRCLTAVLWGGGPPGANAGLKNLSCMRFGTGRTRPSVQCSFRRYLVLVSQCSRYYRSICPGGCTAQGAVGSLCCSLRSPRMTTHELKRVDVCRVHRGGPPRPGIFKGTISASCNSMKYPHHGRRAVDLYVIAKKHVGRSRAANEILVIHL